MTTETEILYSLIGRRIAELRKHKGLTQAGLASRLSRKRSQVWMSTVESGHRSVNANDLFEIASILEATVGDLYSTLSQTPSSSLKSLRDTVSELDSRLPIEMPVYLQRNLGEKNPTPVDYQYMCKLPEGSVFNTDHAVSQGGNLSAMVVERYYDSPKVEPTDLLTYSDILTPQSDPDGRVTDRILVRLKEPFVGMDVHPCLINPSGDAEMTLSGHQKTVFPAGTYEILGVLVLRRTLYRTSTMRTWIQRQFGIVKDERLVE